MQHFFRCCSVFLYQNNINIAYIRLTLGRVHAVELKVSRSLLKHLRRLCCAIGRQTLFKAGTTVRIASQTHEQNNHFGASVGV